MVVEITSSLHVSVAAWANKLNHLSFAEASHVFFVVFYMY
jgi:acyl-CoA hydrolase